MSPPRLRPVPAADQPLDALHAAGCDRIWTEHGSGDDRDRGQLSDLLDHARRGDAAVITKLGWLAWSVTHLVALAAHFDAEVIGLVVLDRAST